MIVEMAKLRILGPRPRLPEVLRALQDLELLHLSEPRSVPELRLVAVPGREERVAKRLEAALEDVEFVLERLPEAEAGPPRPAGVAEEEGPVSWLRLGRRSRREMEALLQERRALEEERALLARYRRFFDAFEALLAAEGWWEGARTYPLVLEPGQAEGEERFRDALEETLGSGFELLARTLEAGEVAAVLVVPARSARRVESLMEDAGIQELPVPTGYEGETLGDVAPALEARLREVDRRLKEIEEWLWRLSSERGPALRRARTGICDRLLELEALTRAAETDGAFVLEGWVPAGAEGRLAEALVERFDETVVVERLSTEAWESVDAPVVLSNPRLFRPFEAITRMVPLPRYGSIDPTPFVAVFFPMFFGIILGDAGYGAILGGIALLLHRKSRPSTLLRSVAEIAGACAVFSVIFGLLYGELLGDLGRRWLGLRPLAFDREEALLPFLALAVALGVVHIMLGLVLGAVEAIRGGGRREGLGKGLAAAMVLLTAVALLAALEVLPREFFTPAIVALLVAFPVLVLAEGFLAPLELLSTLGNVLSYARIMALGTASVMMAVIANRMVGTLGSVAVGAAFGLLFHLVSFALGVFAPTIHGLRLHYVEFFGKFYSPGGTRYRPFGHWRAEAGYSPRPGDRSPADGGITAARGR